MNFSSRLAAFGRSLTSLRLILGLLFLVMLLLFCRGWLPGMLIFANDAPLGFQQTAYLNPNDSYNGTWMDTNWLGLNAGARLPNISTLLAWMVGPVFYSKLHAPISLVIVGLGAWFLFRQLGFSKMTAVLGGLAGALNSDFFATACWGVAEQPICFGLCYFALGLLVNLEHQPWKRIVLAGMAVGMGVIQAFDIGAIFSVFVAAYLTYQAFFTNSTPLGKRILTSVAQLAVVAVAAFLVAAFAMGMLITTQIKGVAGMAQDEQTKAMRWSEATQWSVPTEEALGILVPGLFGFRMDTPMYLPEDMQKSHAAGAYWGRGGRDAAWDAYLASDRKGPTPVQGQFLRYGGGGGYAGILVLLVAAWAVLQSVRGDKSFFTSNQRRMLWFWLFVMVVSAALMFGRYAPFYHVFYYFVPYASTIRNPAKFMHVLEWALIVVFGYGLHGLTTLYLDRATATSRGVMDQFGVWWKQTTGFDKAWVRGMFIALALAALAWFVYHGLRGKVEAHVADLNQCEILQRGGRPDPVAAADAAAATIGFSLKQCGWAFGFLAAAVATLTVLISGGFAGKRARAAGVILGLLVVVDLGWQNRPWVIAQNWTGRYVEAAQNPVFDFLRTKPYEHRVGNIPSHYLRAFQLDPRLVDLENMFQSVYGSEWTQHLFPYYNIQTISVVQMPRRPLDYDVFEQALQLYSNETIHNVARRWQLTNTRYIACATPLLGLLNQGFDAGQKRFQPRLQFDFYQDRQGGPILIRTNENGRYAIVEFTGALPRAKLYSNWEAVPYETNRVTGWLESIRKAYPPQYPLPFDSLSTNDLATIEVLTRASFDPAQQVLLAEPIATKPDTNATPGTVEYVSYAPKKIVLKTKSTAPNVLLLNDRYDPNWQVTIDGQPAKLLRCNYLMRGVEVPAGEHQVEFHFRPDVKFLYVSLAALGLGVVLIGCLLLGPQKPETDAGEKASPPAKAKS